MRYFVYLFQSKNFRQFIPILQTSSTFAWLDIRPDRNISFLFSLSFSCACVFHGRSPNSQRSGQCFFPSLFEITFQVKRSLLVPSDKNCRLFLLRGPAHNRGKQRADLRHFRRCQIGKALWFQHHFTLEHFPLNCRRGIFGYKAMQICGKRIGISPV